MTKEMATEIVNASIVVLAEEHNPTILHPSFLAKERIVDEDWGLKEPPVCTPPYSRVHYSNGILFVVELNKLQVIDTTPSEDPADWQIHKLISTYIQSLPHVRYTAVGMNLEGFLPCSSPEVFLIDRFLKKGVWDSDSFDLKTLGIDFVYEVEDSRLRLSCDSGRIRTDEKPAKRGGIVIRANYHSDLSDLEPLASAKHIIENFPQRSRHFMRSVELILKGEG